jgi:aminocarboxymuconate-semialdehyde decarboxylase
MPAAQRGPICCCPLFLREEIAMKIDIHSHIETPDAAALLPAGHETTNSPLSAESAAYQKAHNEAIRDQILNPRRKIADMKAMGLDVTVLSITPSQFFYNADDALAARVARLQNDRIAALVEGYPQNFIGAATVPMQNVKAAVAELERSVVELKLQGVEVGSNIRGRYLGDPIFLPFFEKARDLNVPVFIHPCNVAGAERMADYYLPNLIGNPLDTTITAATLIFSGIFDRLPGVKILLEHAGGHLPYIIGRFNHGWKVRPECRKYIRRSPVEYLGEFYYDTIAHGPEALAYLISRVGVARVMIGTDHPYDMGDMDPLGSLAAVAGLTPEAKEMIAGGNAASLLRR